MTEKNSSPKDVYDEGFAAGNSGMSNSYIPFKYQTVTELSLKWQQGWEDGAKAAGLHSSRKFWKMLITCGLLSAIAFMIYDFYSKSYFFSPSLVTQKTENISQQNFEITPLNNPEKSTSFTKKLLFEEIIKEENIHTTTSVVTEIPTKKSDTEEEGEEEKANFSSQSTSQSGTKNGTKREEKNKEIEEQSTHNVALAISKPQIKDKFADYVESASFAKVIINRNPVEVLVGKTAYLNTLFFYTKFKGALGKNIIHSWYYQNNLIRQTAFKEIQGNAWRLYSEQTILPTQRGLWSVKVTDAQNNLYAQESIVVE